MLVANFEVMVEGIHVEMVVVALVITKYALMVNVCRIEGVARITLIVKITKFV
jgi:hypothetical protein